LLSYSNFGSRDGDSAFKMREVYRLLKAQAPDLIVEGEMQGDLALNQDLRERYIPDSVLKGEANLLLFPNLDSANLSMTLLKEMNNALAVGPILMGTQAPAHILAPSTTSRGIVNMAAIAASEAVSSEGSGGWSGTRWCSIPSMLPARCRRSRSCAMPARRWRPFRASSASSSSSRSRRRTTTLSASRWSSPTRTPTTPTTPIPST